jgi:phosphatidate phosphatase PAH1
VAVPAGTLTSPGVYEARFQVLGDRSLSTASVWVLPAGTHLAVTDIDATLSTSDFELFSQILDGSYVPSAFPDATTLTRAHADDGQIVVYLTGRPYWLTAPSRTWLADLGFAAGPLIVAPSNGDALPTEGGVGDFKRAQIEALRARGYVVDVAYGNASTDIYAYLGAGLDPDRIWIIGEHGGEQGTHAVPTGTWTERAAAIEASPEVVQPFAW